MVVIQDGLTEVGEDVTGLEVDLTELDENVDFLFDEHIIQDERLFSLEQTTDAINAELVAVDDELEGEVITIRPRKYSDNIETIIHKF